MTAGPRFGRPVGFLAGWWNYLAWVFGSASMAFIWSNIIVQMYALKHPDYSPERWQVILVFIISTWTACICVCLFNNAMPVLNKVGLVAVITGLLVTVIVLAVMPGRGGRPPHASSSFVWTQWEADIGYPSGVVFLTGMLNGAYSLGCVDAITHLAEEIPNPERNVPIALAFQILAGIVTGFCYLVTLMYAINDYDKLFASPFPIAEIYRQGTGSEDGAIILLSLVLVCIGICMCGLYITCGRTLWALARDGGTPCSRILSKVHPKLHMPLPASIATACLVTVLGCLYIGSSTAFNAFVGSYVLMSSGSYIATILPHIITRRKHIVPGPFRLRGAAAYLVNIVACSYMMIWFVIYCFPFALPVTAQSMNYASLIWGGCTIFLGVYWFGYARKRYIGPVTGGLTLGIPTRVDHNA